MTKENKILSDIIVHMKYAKYIPELKRRETWDELVDRNMAMHIKKYPYLELDIEAIYNNYVRPKYILPSMRSLQFAGKAIDVNNVRIFNCAYLPADNIHAFSETMFLLLSGVGVGYSIKPVDIYKIPTITKPNKHRRRKYVIQDSIVGWADAIKVLMKSYIGKTTSTINFDYSEIREKGMPLITAGGKAPGPGPLKICIAQIEAVLSSKKDGDNLTPIEVHDILCYIADAVLSGGIRRSAMISLFDVHEEGLLNAKSGMWWESEPQRGRANNSVVLDRKTTDYEKFNYIWKKTKASRAGEPGIFWTNDEKWGTNPCAEIALRPNQVCNLVEINGRAIQSQDQFNVITRAAAFLATLQAGYTDFHYLRDIWKENTEKDALLGISITGLANKELLSLDFSQAAMIARVTNKEVAETIGINPAARLTAVKPAGTTSLVFGTSSGIHAYHSNYYIRRIQLTKGDPISDYLTLNHPELIEENESKRGEYILSIPQKAPENSITRKESAIQLLERVKKVYTEWIKPGHLDGANTHNVSCTVSVKDEEWDIVRDWMWTNRNSYTGISVLPYDIGTYKQPPFEEITEAQYEERVKHLHRIDLTKIVELQDTTDLKGELACSGGSCEIT